jgi:protein-tyrosine phosphatase
MDGENLADISDLIGPDTEHKVHLLLSFAGERKAVSDPWYTRDFAAAYRDISTGCEALLKEALKTRM